MELSRYSTDRDSNGKFVKGNSASKGHGSEINKKLQMLRSLWYDANSVMDMVQVKQELLNLIKTCVIWDVKLKAIIYYLDRQLGRPTERVEMDVQSDESSHTVNNFNLSPDQIAVVAKIIQQVDAPKEIA